MIITLDNHVGLPFLEGLCADLQMQIAQRQALASARKNRDRNVTFAGWQRAASKAATVVCAVTGALIALLELHPSL